MNEVYEGDDLLLDEAYVVKLDVEHFEPDTEYFLTLIEDVRFDHEGICDVLYGWSEGYETYRKLMSKGSKALDKEEANGEKL